MATNLSVCSTEDGDDSRLPRGGSTADSGVGVQDDASDICDDSLGVMRVMVRQNGTSVGSFGRDMFDISMDSALQSMDVSDTLGISVDVSVVSMDLPDVHMDIPEVSVDAPDVSIESAVGADVPAVSVTVSVEGVSQLSPQDVEVVRTGSARSRSSPLQPSLPAHLAHLSELQFVLPSDKAWRSRNYFKLVEKQRALGATPMASAKEVVVAGPEQRLSPTHWQPLAKRPRHPGPQVSIASSLGSAASQEAALPAWSCADLAKTGRLLAQPPTPVDFDDEAEMRRVFALAYDVFRYKNVLQQALEDCEFFKHFPQHAGSGPRAWLLLYDLNKRHFRPREAMDLHAPPPCLGPADSRQVLLQAGLAEMDDDLWEMRVHLAAALARLRVRRRALRLSQLLPVHLRDGRTINHEDALVTGWINTFKSSRQQVCAGLERLGLRLKDDGLAGRDLTLHAAREGAASVSQEDFRFDPVVPNVIVCHPEQRDDLAQAALVRKCYLVMQDRAFCFGPAMMCKLLSDYDLSGCVAQTHIQSPRSTAYLAAILADNCKIDTLLAFGAGPRRQQYKAYFRKLGVTNAEVYEERFLDVHGSSLLDNVVAILATPPNSYSAVTDPVDLVCSRGGDLTMLQQLTESSGPGGAAGTVGATMIKEQADTLRLCMAKPQVQFVVYETHSVYSSENQRLVRKMVREMNALARERHAEEHRRAAWLASLAAAAEQGVPGEKRAKQQAAEQEAKQEAESKEDKKEEKKEDKKEEKKGKRDKKGKSKNVPAKQDDRPPSSMGGMLASVALSVVMERRRSSAASEQPAVAPDQEPPPAESPSEQPPTEAASEVQVAVQGAGDPEQKDHERLQEKEESLPELQSDQPLEQSPDQPSEEQPSREVTLPPPPQPEQPAPAVQVPPCDLFEIGVLPDLCPRGDGCLSMRSDGCFLALIKRQEIVRMDANYMIKMAEARGLFGSAPGVRRTTAAERARMKREREEAEARARGRSSRRSGGGAGPLDVERLSAPTRASRARQQRIPPRPRRASNMSWESDDSHAGPDLAVPGDACPRYAQHMQAVEAAPARLVEARRRETRRWWSETTRHMAALGVSGWRYLVGPGPSDHCRLRLTRSAIETAPTFAVCSMHRHPFPLRVCLLEL